MWAPPKSGERKINRQQAKPATVQTHAPSHY